MHWDVTAGLVEATVERGKEDEAVEGGRVEVVVVIVEVGASIEEVRGKVEVAGFSSQILVSLLYRQVVACRHSLFVRLSHVNAVEADAGPRKSAVRISNAARVKQCISSWFPLLFFSHLFSFPFSITTLLGPSTLPVGEIIARHPQRHDGRE